ncbi:LamG domain-containing protein, partial [Nonomuraea sp. NPDC002799]
QIGFNSEQTTTPFTRTVIAGSGNSISAPSPQTSGGQSHTFTSWSDGGAASHQVVAPATATTYTAVFTPVPPTTGLVAAYGMNEGTGSAVADSSGGGNHGTGTGTSWTASGRYGRALSFNGLYSWVNVPDSAGLRLTGGMTLEAWVRPASVSNWRTVVMKRHSGGLAYALSAGAPDQRAHARVHTTAAANLASTAALPVNTWSHLAATYDGAAIRLFVNGVQVSQQAVTGNIRTDGGALRIGGNSLLSQVFSGQIDEVRIYNGALTQPQIQTDMNTPVS